MNEYILVAAIIVIAAMAFTLWAALKSAHDADIKSGEHDENGG